MTRIRRVELGPRRRIGLRPVPRPRSRVCAVAAAFAALVGGCAPTAVTFEFGDPRRDLRETEVARDDGAEGKVALIDARGLITEAATPGLTGPGPNAVDEVVARLDKAARDESVRAVVLRINSPGGTVTASDTLYGEIRRFRDRTGKPVVASLGEVAASGGYYIALAADEIVAQPTSLTGSIGVIIQTFNISDGLDRLGIRPRAYTSGPNKDLASPVATERDGHAAILQGMVDEFHGRFRGLVAARRPGVTPADLDESTDGRVMTGAEAVRRGLADREGTLRDAFDRAKALAGIDGAALVRYHASRTGPRTPFATEAGDLSPRAAGAGAFDAGEMLSRLGLPPGPNAYYLWAPGLWAAE